MREVTMYEAFFGLSEKPFNLTPDPRFLYRSPKHEEAFGHLKYAIDNRTGFVMVSGEVGTGKTTICRSLLNELDSETELAFIFNPMLSPKELLRAINEDFGIQSRGDTIKELIDELNEYLLERNSAGKNCVLVIDEAQNLKPEVLEQVRLLSNLETETQKLLQIVLIGQPELAMNLELPELRQLNQRITARYHLKALSEKETLQYIAYRLRVAGGLGKVRFTRGAVRIIYRVSGGTPRMINAIADRALIVAYTRETREISTSMVRQAVREIHGESVKMASKAIAAAKPAPRVSETSLVPSESDRHGRRWVPSPLLVLFAVFVVVAGWYGFVTWGEWAPRLGVLLPAPAPAAVVSSPQAVPATPTAPAATESATPAVPSEAAPAASAPVSPATATPAPAAVAAQESAVPETPFTAQLRALDPDAARRAAAKALLGLWGVEAKDRLPASDSWDDLLAFAHAYGMQDSPMYPTVDYLRAINLPAFVRMSVDDHAVWLALVGADGDDLRVTLAEDATAVVSREQFEAHFTTECLILWREPTPVPRILGIPMSGLDVKELQSNLRALRWYNGPISGQYDEATADAIKKIEAQTGLKVDGITGQNVRMVLTSWLSNGSTPSLRPIPPFNPYTVTSFLPEEARPKESADSSPDPEAASNSQAPTPESQPLPDTDSPIVNQQSPTVDPQSSIPNPQSPIPNRQSSIVNPQSSIPSPSESQPLPNIDSPTVDPQSSIVNRQSSIPNPQSDTLPVYQRVKAEELPPPAEAGPKEVTEPAAATLPLVPHERDENEGEPGGAG